VTPAAIYTAVKDLLILGVLAWVVWFLVSSGEDRVKVQNLEALQKQIVANAATEAKWQKDKDAHDAQLQNDIDSARAAIAARSAPIIVRVNPGSGVPAASAKAGSSNPQSGGSVEGAGVDIRPRVNAFELKLEQTIADCHKLEDPHD
jgi:hypothetical protein